MTRILITGGFGGIGQHIVRYLLEDKENEVTIFDLKNRNNENVARDIIFQNDNAKVNWGDITKPTTYPDMSKFDAVIHMAFIIPPLSETLPEKITERVNIEGTKLFIDTAKNQGFKGKFIFASSVSVFGPTRLIDRPIEPNDPINPTDRYTYQKAYCEK
jgi:nucleoside-diphosphate-sugar epimerase